ncbi:MAG: Do family serine endopeptidase [Saprospiraceae bacterium]|nr:Do family serine endopeptidase [Saprospiraceae bacterium]
MKKYIFLAATYLVSSMSGALIYRLFDEPREVVIREDSSARYAATLGEDPLDEVRPRTFLSASPTEFTGAAGAATPAVVNIRTMQKGRNFHFWGEGVNTATGSGVILSADGLIVTNNHVIEGADRIEITLNDKREFEAEVIGVDPSTDLALLRIKAANLPFMPFGNSDSLRVGEWVLAVGNPFNLESTVTAGIVSAKGRSIDILEGQDRIESFIQTDAAVNPGNSGGALVNSNGELIGINTAIITRSGRYEGYSFAVPANLVRKVIRDLRDYGTVQRGLLGVFIENLNSRQAEALGLESVEGVLITRVSPGGAAEEAGMRKGDVIIRINNVKTRTLSEMQEQVGRFRPGNVLSVEYIREGKANQAKVILKNKTNDTALVTARDESMLRDLGFELRSLTREERRRLGVNGLKVISVYRDTKIEKTNMEPGFVITRVNGKSLSALEELTAAISGATGKILLEGIYENYSETYYYSFIME